MEPRAPTELEAALGHTFANPALREQALTHRSFRHERGTGEDNERLEFLGDAVVNLALADLLMGKFPRLDEGDLTIARSRLGDEPALAQAARRLNLGCWVHVGQGEERSRDRPGLLADTLEALLGAVYLDAGCSASLGAAKRILERLVADLQVPQKSPKTRLQEICQSQEVRVPTYRQVTRDGPDHAPRFVVAVEAAGLRAEAEGASLQQAEQLAAEKLLSRLEVPGKS